MKRLVVVSTLALLASASASPAFAEAGEGATVAEEAASPWAVAFYWVVAVGALIYLVISRRGDKKKCKHEESAFRTAERKRLVREEMVRRAKDKLADAERKLEVMQSRDVSERDLEAARTDHELCQRHLENAYATLATAEQVEAEALAALEACEMANAAPAESDDPESANPSKDEPR